MEQEKELIKIVGEKELFPLSEVEKATVKMKNGRRYWRHDHRIEKVKGRYHFKSSGNIVNDYRTSEWILKEDAVMLSYEIYGSQDLFVEKGSAVQSLYLGNYTYILRADATSVEGEYYYRLDSRLRECMFSGKMMLDKGKNTQKIITKYGKSNFYYPYLKKYSRKIIKIGDDYCLKSDCYEVRRYNNDSIFYSPEHRITGKESIMELGTDFRVGDPLASYVNPKKGKLITKILVPQRNQVRGNTELCFCSQEDREHLITISIGTTNFYTFSEEIADYANRVALLRSDNIEDIKVALEKIYPESDEENKAAVGSVIHPARKTRGGEPYFLSSQPPLISNTADKVAGLKYTFGVEFETSFGEIRDNKLLENLHLSRFGDGSIGSDEYVTRVLHGTKGMNMMAKQCDTLSKNCYIDSRCSTHVHVGGYSDSRVWQPNMNLLNAFLAIKLGTQIEAELYAMCPPSRSPFEKYCASITSTGRAVDGNSYAEDFSDITKENHREMVLKYVYKGKPMRDRGAEFNEQLNRRISVGRWNHGRYRWLNLTHMINDSRGFNTMEVRIWPATMNYNKARMYVIISQAMMWFIENRPSRILEGDVDLQEVIISACKKNAPEVLDFIHSRVKKFEHLYEKRGGIYS